MSEFGGKSMDVISSPVCCKNPIPVYEMKVKCLDEAKFMRGQPPACPSWGM